MCLKKKKKKKERKKKKKGIVSFEGKLIASDKLVFILPIRETRRRSNLLQ